ncbi:hypothetical protein H8K47_04165 [Undibacterium sp. CY7W]|uniref:Uncharacterized protein n=1 Tax=Undibacterium rugosum TaxID=2762291 RepID=A0A923HYK7_9BURK|nr:hypothetical protein [Undibacterium rugosum]
MVRLDEGEPGLDYVGGNAAYAAGCGAVGSVLLRRAMSVAAQAGVSQPNLTSRRVNEVLVGAMQIGARRSVRQYA